MKGKEPPQKWIASTVHDVAGAYSPDGTKIAFSSNRSGSRESPRCSPGGRWIAFDSRARGRPDVFVISEKGVGRRRLTDGTNRLERSNHAGTWQEAWLADGNSIYFTSDRSAAFEIWRMPWGGGRAVQLTKAAGDSVAPGPDNQRIYYVRGQPGTLWRIRPDGSGDALVRHGHGLDVGRRVPLAAAPPLDVRPEKLLMRESLTRPIPMNSNGINKYSRMMRRPLCLAGLFAFTFGSAFAQHQAIDFNPQMPFSEGYIAGNTLYVAGQQGPDSHGNVTGTDITLQTTNAIAAVEKVVKKAGFQMTDIVSVTVYVTDLNDVPRMNDVYKKLMPNPKPARATVQVAGLIGGAKIEISAIAAKH